MSAPERDQRIGRASGSGVQSPARQRVGVVVPYEGANRIDVLRSNAVCAEDEREAAQAAVIPEILQLRDVAVFVEAADVESVPLLEGSEPGSEEEDADPEGVVRDEVSHCEKRSLLRHAPRVGDQRREGREGPHKAHEDDSADIRVEVHSALRQREQQPVEEAASQVDRERSPWEGASGETLDET